MWCVSPLSWSPIDINRTTTIESLSQQILVPLAEVPDPHGKDIRSLPLMGSLSCCRLRRLGPHPYQLAWLSPGVKLGLLRLNLTLGDHKTLPGYHPDVTPRYTWHVSSSRWSTVSVLGLNSSTGSGTPTKSFFG